MYTKTQFNQLLKTRKHWTGKQLGRLLLQAGVETLNGKAPVVTTEEITPLVKQLTSKKDIEDYTMYANIYSGMTSAWNFVNAVGNEAVANLTYIRSIISRLRDFSSAELTNQQRPVMITQGEYLEYKEKYDKAWKSLKEATLNKKITLGELLIDALPTFEGDARLYGPKARKVITRYQKKFFSKEDINLLRIFMQEHHYTQASSAMRKADNELLLHSFDTLKSPELFQFVGPKTKLFLITNYLKRQRPTTQVDIDRYAKEAIKKYVKIIDARQLELIYSTNLTFDEALAKALKEYPFEYPGYRNDHNDTVPYVPDHLSYADLFFTNKDTQDLAAAFWAYTYMKHDHPDTKYDEFIQSHFVEFIKASKKDLIQKYPKMSNILNEATNSTSFIIPQFTYQTLATVGFSVFQDLISDDAIDDGIRFYNMFPENRRKQAKFAGYAIYHSDASTPDPHKESEHSAMILGDDWLSSIQHYDIQNFVPDTFKYNEKRLKEAFDSLTYYTKVQATYEDYFKGLARIMNDTSFRKYSTTTAYSAFIEGVKSYKEDILGLLSYLSQIIEGHKSKVKIIDAIKKSLPMVQTSYPNYKHKTIKELASLLEQSYRTSIPVSVMNVFNVISEGAD